MRKNQKTHPKFAKPGSCVLAVDGRLERFIEVSPEAIHRMNLVKSIGCRLIESRAKETFEGPHLVARLAEGQRCEEEKEDYKKNGVES